MPPVGFKPTISAGEWSKTYALDRAATGSGTYYRVIDLKWLFEIKIREAGALEATLSIYCLMCWILETWTSLLLQKCDAQLHRSIESMEHVFFLLGASAKLWKVTN